MALFLSSLLVLVLAMLGLAAGLLLRGRPLAGTCAGLAAGAMGDDCPVCGRNVAEGVERRSFLPAARNPMRPP